MTEKIECPRCHETRSKVINSRPGKSSDGYWRRRECQACGYRYSTEEVVRGAHSPQHLAVPPS